MTTGHATVDPAPELIRLITRAFMHDPYPSLRDLRARGRAVPIENNGMRMWVGQRGWRVTRHVGRTA